MNCPDCSKRISPSSSYCDWCGMFIQKNVIVRELRRSSHLYCKYCFNVAENSSMLYCSTCGLKYNYNSKL